MEKDRLGFFLAFYTFLGNERGENRTIPVFELRFGSGGRIVACFLLSLPCKRGDLMMRKLRYGPVTLLIAADIR